MKINKKIVMDLINKYIIELELNDYIKNIYFVNLFNKPIAEYNFYKKRIIVRNYKDNTDLLFILFHEITHAEQHKISLENNNNKLKNIFIRNFSFIDENYKLYNNYYKLFPIEHHANSKSSMLLMDYLDYTEQEKTKKIVLYLLSNYLNKKTLFSPIEMLYYNLEFDFTEDDIKLYNKLSNIDKLMLGLPIDIELYNELNSILNNNKLVYDSKHYIKSLN